MSKSQQRILTLFILLLGFIGKAYAICPVCTVLVGAGVGLSRWLGIDDTISGIWIGGFTVSLIAWTIDWCNRKNIRFYGRKILIIVSYYAIVALPLYYSDIIGHPFNKIWGYDKLMVGITVGSFAFIAATVSYLIMKKHHNNHAYFPMQKVVMPVGSLVLLSLIFYFITK